MRQKDSSICDKSDIIIPCSATHFLEEEACISLKVATKGYIRGKDFPKIYIFRLLCTEECNRKDVLVSDKFGIIIRCSAKYFLEVGARFILKVATKGSVRGKKIKTLTFLRLFFKAKMEE